MEYIDESTARSEIIKAGERLYQRGLVCANDGNISVRISDNLVIATPSGVSKGFMTMDSLVKLTLDGEVVADEAMTDEAKTAEAITGEVKTGEIKTGRAKISKAKTGGATTDESMPGEAKTGETLIKTLKPSSEIKMHLAIYKHSPSITAVCHAHPPVASAFAAEGVPLDRAHLQETAMLLGVIPVASYAAPGSEELAEGAAKLSGDYHGALLEQHGVVTWGSDVTQALFRMESVEYTATVAMNMRVMGFKRTLSKSQIDELIEMRSKWGITAGLGEFK